MKMMMSKIVTLSTYVPENNNNNNIIGGHQFMNNNSCNEIIGEEID